MPGRHPFSHGLTSAGRGRTRGLAVAAWTCLAAPLAAGDEPAALESAAGTAPPGADAPAEAKEADLAVRKLFRFDGQLRFRFEYLDPFSYTSSGVDQSDDYVLMRTRLGALFTPHRRIAARLQLQDSRIWGEEGADTPTSPSSSVTSSTDNLDVHLAHVDVSHIFEEWLDDALLLRVGRQELSYGDQRLVSPLDWSNIARAWDAAKLRFAPASAPGGLTVDVFASIIRDTTSSDAGGGPTGVTSTDQKQGFHGLYASFEEIHPAAGWTRTDGVGRERPVLGKHVLDLYTFYRDLSDGVFTAEDGTTGDVDEVTIGTRLAGGLLRDEAGGGFDYTGEAAYQTGEFVDDSILAYGYALTLGYMFAGGALAASKVRLGVEYDYGSGDRDPADGRHETFDPLFPFGHSYQGIQDTFSWKNGQDLAFKIDVFPPKSTRIPHAEIQYHAFWLSGRKDGWFNAALAELRRDPTGSSGRFVGHEVASLDNFLAETVEGSRMPFDPHSPTPGKAVSKVNGMASAFLGCMQCHGSKVGLKSTDGGMVTAADLKPGPDGRPTSLDAAAKVLKDPNGKPLFHPATWPNTGIGRINLDGSLGACSACHSRHDFSPRRARQPESCGKCHMGPDHPQKEIFEESKHGVAFRDLKDTMNLDGESWVLGQDYSQAPTCATCHVSGHTRNYGKVTHDPGIRISWTNRPPVSLVMDTDANGKVVTESDPARRQELIADTAEAKRTRMKEVCSHCHTSDYVNAFYQQYDDLVILYNEKFAKPGQAIMGALRANGLLTPMEFDEEIEWTWFYLWHHEGRRARMGASMMGPDYTHWHGMYEVAERFYMELIPQARELIEHAAGNGKKAEADAAVAVVDEILKRPEHAWQARGAEPPRPLQPR